MYLHIVTLPGLITDGLFYRTPIEKGCVIDSTKQFTWSVVNIILLYDFPFACIFLAHSVICFCEIKRQAKRRSRLKLAALDLADRASWRELNKG